MNSPFSSILILKKKEANLFYFIIFDLMAGFNFIMNFAGQRQIYREMGPFIIEERRSEARDGE